MAYRTDVASPEDINFRNVLDSTLVNIPKILGTEKNELRSFAEESPSFSEEYQPFFEAIYSYIPLYLGYRFGIQLDKQKAAVYYKASSGFPVLKELPQQIFDNLQKNKIKVNTLKPILKKLATFHKQEDKFGTFIEAFNELLDDLKTKKLQSPKNLFNANDRKVFKALLQVRISSTVEDASTSIALILKNKILLRNVPLINLIKSMKTPEAQKATTDYTSGVEELKQIEKDYFKTNNPSVEQLDKLNKKSPEKYKEYRKIRNRVKNHAKDLIKEKWIERDYSVEDVSVARSLMEELGIEDMIPEKFKGKVSVAPDSRVFFYYTMSGNKLNGTPVGNIVMNKQYNEKTDNGYYCLYYPENSKTGKPVGLYTVNFKTKNNGNKFAIVSELANSIEDVRISISKLAANTKGSKGTEETYIIARLVQLADHCCARIGNAESAKNELTYGLHNIKVKHVFKDGENLVLQYPGKGANRKKSEKPTENFITDPELVSFIKSMCKGKGKEDDVFTVKGKLISPDKINKFLKDFSGIGELSIHKFRHYHATRIFTEVTSEEIKKPVTVEKVLALFNKGAEKAAEKLANEPNTCIKNYIDPSVMVSFFMKYKIEKRYWPKILIETLKVSSFKPTSEEEE